MGGESWWTGVTVARVTLMAMQYFACAEITTSGIDRHEEMGNPGACSTSVREYRQEFFEMNRLIGWTSWRKLNETCAHSDGPRHLGSQFR